MRVLLADDSALLRAGIASLLGELGHEVVGGAGDVDGLMDMLNLDPDIILVDVRMPPTHTVEGIQAAAQIRQVRPGQAILVLSQYIEPAYTSQLLADNPGGLGYLLKDRVIDAGELVDAMHRVVAGQTVVDPEVVTAMLRVARSPDPIAQLSAREREVLGLMAEGRSNSSIAQTLVLTERTVETHVRNIFTRLGLSPTANDHRRVLAVLAFLGPGY